MNYHVKQTVQPDYYSLISVRDAEQHLHMVENEDAAYISGLIPAAINMVEHHINGAVLVGTYLLYLDYFPYHIELPKPPTAVITSVQYYDTDNTLQTVDSSNYLSSESQYGTTTIEPVDSYTWPTTYRRKGAVVVTYTAGYEPQNVPLAIKQAALVMLGEMYASRQQSVEKEMYYNRTFENLLAPYVNRTV